MDRRYAIESPQEVLVLCRERDVRAVDLRFSDIQGRMHHKTVPVSQLTEDSFEDGFRFDDLHLSGFGKPDAAEMLLIPQPSTAWIDPFCAISTVVLNCAIQDPLTREDDLFDSRSIARRAENFLIGTGISDEALFGALVEFFIFDSVGYDQTPSTAFYEIHSDEANWNRRPGAFSLSPLQTPVPRTRESFFPCTPADHTVEMRGEMMQTLVTSGVQVESQHHAVAAPGQAGIRLQPKRIVELADALMNFKYIVKNVAHRHGRSVTFMPKPLIGNHASGLHFDISLWKAGEPLVAGSGFGGLSDAGLHAIGGILRHAPALLALTNPTTNSYKRLVPNGYAPIQLGYSPKLRTAACRVPISSPSPKSKRIDFRCPDPSCNPYLATAAILMAAIDGIQNKIDPGDPMEDNAQGHDSGNPNQTPTTPNTLEAALIALENDSDFLLRGEVFSEELLRNWIAFKRDTEIAALRARPHPYEFCMYYDL